MKIEEYVPETIPMSSASTNEWIAAPPNRNSAVSVMTTVSDVLMDRPSVCRMLWLTMASNGSPGVTDAVLADSVEHHDRVVDAEADDGQHRGHEQGVDLEPDERAQDGEDADHHDDVVEQRDTSAMTPIRKSRKRNVIQSMMPTAPMRMQQERLLDELLA